MQGAIAELGFVRNSNAQQLAAGRSSSIGLVVIDISNSLFVDIARGAQRFAAELGMNVLVANSDNRADQQRADLDFFDEARVSGILLARWRMPATTSPASGVTGGDRRAQLRLGQG